MKKRGFFGNLSIEKEKQSEANKKVLEKYKEIYNLFVRASKKEELQEIERWLLR